MPSAGVLPFPEISKNLQLPSTPWPLTSPGSVHVQAVGMRHGGQIPVRDFPGLGRPADQGAPGPRRFQKTPRTGLCQEAG